MHTKIKRQPHNTVWWDSPFPNYIIQIKVNCCFCLNVGIIVAQRKSEAKQWETFWLSQTVEHGKAFSLLLFLSFAGWADRPTVPHAPFNIGMHQQCAPCAFDVHFIVCLQNIQDAWKCWKCDNRWLRILLVRLSPGHIAYDVFDACWPVSWINYWCFERSSSPVAIYLLVERYPLANCWPQKSK